MVRPLAIGEERAKIAYWHGEWPVCVLLTAVSVIANFLHLASFGLYEDDWYYIACAWKMSPADWFAEMWAAMLSFYLGRPLQEFLLRTFGYWGSAWHSITALYVVAAVLHCVAVWMFYRMLRVRYPQLLAALAALLFAISPLSTIRPFLGGTLCLAPGLALLFAAITAYARRRYAAASYVLAILSLLIYESLFFVFFAAPLFRRGQRRWRAAAIHVAICTAILAVYIWLRLHTSESRLAGVGGTPMSLAGAVLHLMAFYLVRSFHPFVYGAWLGIREISLEAAVWGLLAIAGAVVCLAHLPSAARRRTARFRSRRCRWWLARVLWPACVMLVLGYALTYFACAGYLTFPLNGRDTRFLLAALAGSSLLVAGLLWYPLMSCRRRATRRVAVAAVAALYLLPFLYSFVIQRDYRHEWTHMRQMFAQMMALAPDAEPDTLLIVQRSWIDQPLLPHGARRPSINYQPQGLQIGFSRLFEDYAGPKVMVMYTDEWRTRLAAHADGKFYWTSASFGGVQPDVRVPVTRIVLLAEQPDGSLKRQDEPLVVDGRDVIQPLAPGAQAASKWSALRHTRLWPFVFPDSGQ